MKDLNIKFLYETDLNIDFDYIESELIAYLSKDLYIIFHLLFHQQLVSQNHLQVVKYINIYKKPL